MISGQMVGGSEGRLSHRSKFASGCLCSLTLNDTKGPIGKAMLATSVRVCEGFEVAKGKSKWQG